jgi:hypothetical protein
MLFENNYQKSNRIKKVKSHISNEAILLAKKILNSGDHSVRQKLSESLLDELCDGSKIDIVKLCISNTNQYHKKSAGKVAMKRYGYYRIKGNYIYIQNLTAVRGQILAPKTFLDTLLHEWMHHYDTHRLRLNSIHTKGFYERINNLKEKLKLK